MLPGIAKAIEEARALLGERLSTGSSVLEIHSHDEAYSTPALPDAVAFPESTAEVSELLKICRRHKCPVVPYGIGTSLEGHVIPIQGGITVDTSKMNKILEINESDFDAVVEPGITRTRLNDELRATGLMFTVDPGADATIGGMASTRASGTNTVRYGTMRENVLALEVVLPDGQIINTGSRARKSASGYDLTRLFVGSEGTLGIITKVTVRLFGQPENISAATCTFDTIGDAVDTVIMANQMGIPMARIELLDEVQMRGMNIYNPDMSFPEKPHLFLEFHGTEAGVAEQVELFRSASEEFGASNFEWATKTEDRNRLWQARHNAYYAGKALRPGASSAVTDCCVPISSLAECIARAKELITHSGLIAPLVGHVGDGNFHLLIIFDPDSNSETEAAKVLGASISELALEFNGTVTGEHGVGSGKKKYMLAEHGAAYALMATLKKSIDPDNIMNPGKIVDIN
ncbi:FAD-binding protein [Granulosicoccus sp.]|nr:FAD-linked oxidase C-terminal domain-containing protein [Granulosicoccus sp.]MDB4222650.1 FAD-binding protein [Granulosicoccus sp.]